MREHRTPNTRAAMFPAMSQTVTPRAAIVGAGPSGFYAAGMLLDEGFAVDLYDALPTPYGLVRAGVAPDHPKIKTVTRVFDKTAAREGFRFLGGVELGTDISREDLLARYEVVLYSMGVNVDRRLGIPGEDLIGSHAATEFVAWYNGHPHHATRDYDLDAERAVVIGNGNVAIDVARMLVLDPGELAVTDTADHAIDEFTASGVREAVIVGRRGPAQAAFTNPELRELGELARADVIVDPADAEPDPASAAWLAGDGGDITARKNVEILREYAQREPKGLSHRIALRFLRSPIEILGEGRVEAIRLGINRIEADADGNLRAVPTGEEETLDCGIVIRSIGYAGAPVAGIPFDERRRVINNDGGRVVDEHGEQCVGEYVAGWIKRGPSGVIGTNKKDAADTVAKLLEDREAGRLNEPTTELTADWPHERVTDWQGWQRIDAHEVGRGEPQGRPRVKVVDLDELHRHGRGA